MFLCGADFLYVHHTHTGDHQGQKEPLELESKAIVSHLI